MMIDHRSYQKVVEYFQGDKFKAIAWFDVAQMGLKGKTPNELIKRGRHREVVEFINKLMGGKL
jgi:Protein of unknown function (DUF2384).